MKKVVVFFIVFITILYGYGVCAQSTYEITDFYVKVTVQENNSYEIYEKVNINFKQPSPRFKREIPLRQQHEKVLMRSFEGLNIKAEVKKIPDKVTVLFGESDILVEGERNYSYQYTLSKAADTFPDKDRFYLTVLPDDTNGRILHGKVEVIMPKEFDVSYLSVNIGEQENRFYVPVEINGNSIVIEVNDELLNGQKLNVCLDLPEGYFSKAKPGFKVSESLTLITNCVVAFLVLFCFLVCFILKNNRIKQYREDPVAIMSGSPCEAAYALEGDISIYDIVANIIYWANQGKVSVLFRGSPDKKSPIKCQFKKIEIVKKDDLDLQAKPYEKLIYNLIFSSSTDKNKVTFCELYKILNRKKGEIIEAVNNHYNKPDESIFSKKIVFIREVIRFCASIPYIYITFKTFYAYTGNGGISLILSFICSLFFIILSESICTAIQKFKTHRMQTLKKDYWLNVATSFFVFIFFLLLVKNEDSLHINEYLTMMFSGILISVFSSLLIRRTEKGKQAYADVVAFKNYIWNTPKNSDNGVSEITKYFYNLLPYAMVTGDTEKLFKRLSGKSLLLPPWWETLNRTDNEVHIDQVKEIINHISRHEDNF